MIDQSKPINLNSDEFNSNKFTWYEQIREDLPVHQAKMSIIKVFTIARYDDCTAILKDPRVLRNRSTITGGSRFPFPMPKAIKPIAESMIVEDDPNHRRLRELVRRAFRPQAIEVLETKIDQYSNELLDGLPLKKEFDLKIIKSIGINNKDDLRKIDDLQLSDYFLFDYKPKINELPGGNAKRFDWSLLQNITINKPWFISGGINIDNIEQINNKLIPYGIDISSGVEEKPGIKSSHKINALLKILNV